MNVSENTKLTLDIKTIVMIVAFTISLATTYFTLQAQIQKAMEEPQPEVTAIEYEYKDLLVRESVLRLEEKQTIMADDIKEVKAQLEKIDQRLYELSRK
jgi:hypothetical protein|tara:strand:- start:106 stop:402 length:297 start_codon:yes stop_codon:yes gene_type:complete